MGESIYIGLGGNVGPVQETMRLAARRLSELGPVRLSSLFRTAPVGPVPDQPWFLNCCAQLRAGAGLTPRVLMEVLLDIEQSLGRDRRREQPQGPRRIDLDLLLWGERIVDDPRVVIPHPRLHERAFALAPLVELAPDVVVPGRGRAADLLKGCRISHS